MACASWNHRSGGNYGGDMSETTPGSSQHPDIPGAALAARQRFAAHRTMGAPAS